MSAGVIPRRASHVPSSILCHAERDICLVRNGKLIRASCQINMISFLFRPSPLFNVFVVAGEENFRNNVLFILIFKYFGPGVAGDADA